MGPERLTRTLLLLTFVTGIVDAVSFVGLGQVFAAMQTGNVIFLGLGLGGAAGAPIGLPLLALAAFLLGGLGAVLLSPPGSPPPLRPALSIEVLLLGGAALFALLVDPAPRDAGAYLLVALLSLTMGLRNSVARQIGGPNLATTVLNLTLTAMTAVAPGGAASADDLGQRAAAFLAIAAGAATGALLLQASVGLALLAAALLAAAALTNLSSASAEPQPS
ncbi:MAG: YoaK family protein [Solirubrobacterales bacterium]